MKIGYGRTSTVDQKLDLQIDALEKYGCEQIYSEKKSGTIRNRPELDKMLESLRSGDEVVIWKLDRIGRSLQHLIEIVDIIRSKGAALVSLQDNINTTTASGKLVFHMFGALAEFERSLISERTKAGLAAAKARGRKLGRPEGLSKKAEEKSRLVQSYYEEGKLSVSEICDVVGISRRTFYNYLKRREVILLSESSSY